MPDNNIIEKDLGPVSAWAIAKANGFDGTEAEWEALQANAAQNGSDAEAFAKGTRNGEAVASDDPAYHNNCAYHHAGTSADADTCTTKAAEATAAAATASAAYNVNLLAPNYSAESTYAVGDHVIYNGGYYECISAISTAEAWTAAHWRQLTVGGESADLKSATTNRILLGGLGMIPVENGAVPAPFNDLNTYPANTIYVAGDTATSSLIAHCPIDAPVGRFVVATIEGNPSAPYTRLQFFFNQTNESGQSGDYKNTYFRKEWGSWGNWQRLAKGDEITSIWTSLNSVNNSIANGKFVQAMGEIPVVNGAVAAPLDDIDTYPVNTIYVAGDNATSSLIDNCPIDAPTGRFTVITLEADISSPYTKVQIFISNEQRVFYRRQWGSFASGWHEVAQNTSSLFRAMGTIPVNDGSVASPLNDLNTYPANTIYTAYDEATSSLIAHCPVTQSGGRFVVMTFEGVPSSPYTRVQFFVTKEQEIYFRKEWGSWGNWHNILHGDAIGSAYWSGKSIVWLGTSIPAGGRGPAGRTDNGAYPFKTRQILGNNVDIIDNAVGSSCLWVLKKSLIDASTNPYGYDFTYPWERVERCIGTSIEEKQWMIDHKENWADAPATLSDADKTRILGYSYENLVTPFTDQDRLWIIDYTNNEDSADGFGTYDQNFPFDRYSTKGTLQFFWNMILSNNPKSQIFVLGNYYTDNGIHGQQNEFFEDMAQRWSLPWFPVYKHVDATPLVSIETKGGWDANGYWDNNLYPNGHTMTLKQVFARDGLHPHTDASGKTNKMLGRIIGNWINQQAVWFD